MEYSVKKLNKDWRQKRDIEGTINHIGLELKFNILDSVKKKENALLISMFVSCILKGRVIDNLSRKRNKFL